MEGRKEGRQIRKKEQRETVEKEQVGAAKKETGTGVANN